MRTIQIIDQRLLPHNFAILDLRTLQDFITAIRDMYVRGAGLIGATAGYGRYITAIEAPDDEFEPRMQDAAHKLSETRPTAKNLEWALKRQLEAMEHGPPRGKAVHRLSNSSGHCR